MRSVNASLRYHVYRFFTIWLHVTCDFHSKKKLLIVKYGRSEYSIHDLSKLPILYLQGFSQFQTWLPQMAFEIYKTQSGSCTQCSTPKY